MIILGKTSDVPAIKTNSFGLLTYRSFEHIIFLDKILESYYENELYL
jgi:hypothetical protein